MLTTTNSVAVQRVISGDSTAIVELTVLFMLYTGIHIFKKLLNGFGARRAIRDLFFGTEGVVVCYDSCCLLLCYHRGMGLESTAKGQTVSIGMQRILETPPRYHSTL